MNAAPSAYITQDSRVAARRHLAQLIKSASCIQKVCLIRLVYSCTYINIVCEEERKKKEEKDNTTLMHFALRKYANDFHSAFLKILLAG